MSQSIIGPPPAASAAIVRTLPSTITIAASAIAAISCGRSASVVASTSAATGSSAITVACASGPGAPVDGSIRWCAEPAVAVSPRRRPNPEVATPCPQLARCGRRRGARAERRLDADDVHAARRDQVTARIDQHRRVVASIADDVGGAHRHPALGDPAQIEPCTGGYPRRPRPRSTSMAPRWRCRRARRRVRRDRRAGSARSPRPPAREPISGWNTPCVRSRQLVACVEQIERRLRHPHRCAGCGVDAAHVALGAGTETSVLVGRHGCGETAAATAAVTAPAVVDPPGGAGSRPFPRGGGYGSALRPSARVGGRGGGRGHRRGRRCGWERCRRWWAGPPAGSRAAAAASGVSSPPAGCTGGRAFGTGARCVGRAPPSAWATVCHRPTSARQAAAAVLWLIDQAIATAHTTAITAVYSFKAVLVIAALPAVIGAGDGAACG